MFQHNNYVDDFVFLLLENYRRKDLNKKKLVPLQ